MSDIETIRCCLCGRPARMWTGHLKIAKPILKLWPQVYAGQHVTAGWCCEKHEREGFEWEYGKLKPCVGTWHPSMGLRDERGRVLVRGGKAVKK